MNFENIKIWLKTAYATTIAWLKEKSLKNAGWVVASVIAFVIGWGILGGAFAGIFIEKNRVALKELWQELKPQIIEKIKSK